MQSWHEALCAAFIAHAAYFPPMRIHCVHKFTRSPASAPRHSPLPKIFLDLHATQTLVICAFMYVQDKLLITCASLLVYVYATPAYTCVAGMGCFCGHAGVHTQTHTQTTHLRAHTRMRCFCLCAHARIQVQYIHLYDTSAYSEIIRMTTVCLNPLALAHILLTHTQMKTIIFVSCA